MRRLSLDSANIQRGLNPPLNEVSFNQMEDEIASLAAIIGASLAGMKAITVTSGPGFCKISKRRLGGK
ncbi:MAG: hypothetical protein AB1815_06590 [Bacillota bacterium]